MIYLLSIFFAALVFSLNIFSSEFKQDLSPTIKKMMKRNRISYKQLGYNLIDISDLKIIDSFNSNNTFIPASLTKILTSYFALEILGATYKFTTELSYQGNIIDGKLNGDLYLIGSGDPLLSTPHLMNLALSLKANNIQSITGNFYYLEKQNKSLSKLSTIGLGDQTYNPGISDLSVNFNRFNVINTKKKKKRLILPPLDHIIIKKSPKKLGPGRMYSNDLSLQNQNEIWFYDSRKSYHKIEALPVRRPDLFTVKLFQFLCKKVGIQLPNPRPIKLINEKELVQLKIHFSLDVFTIASLAMEYSNNLLAEQLMLKAAEEYSEKTNLSYKESIQIMEDWLKKHPTIIENNDLKLENASGLTTRNKITPSYLSSLISKIVYKQYSDRFFLTLFSLSGNSGWLKKRLIGKNSSYNVWAKTGSLDYINNISGFLTTPKGKVMAFSIFLNDLDKRMKLENKNSYKLQKLRKQSHNFRQRSKNVADGILEYWLRKY